MGLGRRMERPALPDLDPDHAALCEPISIAVQAPLWTLRVFWKWEIAPGWNAGTSARRQTQAKYGSIGQLLRTYASVDR